MRRSVFSKWTQRSAATPCRRIGTGGGRAGRCVLQKSGLNVLRLIGFASTYSGDRRGPLILLNQTVSFRLGVRQQKHKPGFVCLFALEMTSYCPPHKARRLMFTPSKCSFQRRAQIWPWSELSELCVIKMPQENQHCIRSRGGGGGGLLLYQRGNGDLCVALFIYAGSRLCRSPRVMALLSGVVTPWGYLGKGLQLFETAAVLYRSKFGPPLLTQCFA